MQCTLTALTVGGIQPYIFGSNKLRENIGGSEMIYRATREWAGQVLDEVLKPDGHHNIDLEAIADDRPDFYRTDFALERELATSKAELIYAGGGNTVILFAGENHAALAKQFVYHLSRRVLVEAPGLSLYAAHLDYEWGSVEQSLPTAVVQVMKQINEERSRLHGSTPMLGLGITASCTSTGLPAHGLHLDPNKEGTGASRANRQVLAKWKMADEATKRLRKLYDAEANGFFFTDDLDKIGDIGRDESFVAVVHADGNGMGKRFLSLNQLLNHFPQNPRGSIKAIRALSIAVETTARNALSNIMKYVAQAVRYQEGLPQNQNPARLFHPRHNGTDYFPLRPIVFGGDDVTWVCTSLWGLSTAHDYLTELEQATLPRLADLLHLYLGVDKPEAQRLVDSIPNIPTSSAPYACAGVAIVKSHYPFSRAYEISEELAKSAKKQVLRFHQDKSASAIDWHFTTTGLGGDLDDIRQREYTAGEIYRAIPKPSKPRRMQLVMRPLMLHETHTWRNWKSFHHIWQSFNQPEWREARNKVMSLRQVLHEGPTAVLQFSRAERKGLRLPNLPPWPRDKVLTKETPANPEVAFNNGWADLPGEGRDLKQLLEMQRSYLFDAIEVLDQFVPLTVEATEEPIHE